MRSFREEVAEALKEAKKARLESSLSRKEAVEARAEVSRTKELLEIFDTKIPAERIQPVGGRAESKRQEKKARKRQENARQKTRRTRARRERPNQKQKRGLVERILFSRKD